MVFCFGSSSKPTHSLTHSLALQIMTIGPKDRSDLAKVTERIQSKRAMRALISSLESSGSSNKQDQGPTIEENSQKMLVDIT